MSKIYDSQQGGSSWFLKTGDGAVYGPLDIGQLREWADDCRIAPGNQVSKDKQHWAPVESLPELEMCWMVELANKKTFGPINLSALKDFVKSGAVLPQGRLENLETGEVSTVEALVTPLMGAAPEAAKMVAPPPKSKPATPAAKETVAGVRPVIPSTPIVPSAPAAAATAARCCCSAWRTTPPAGATRSMP